jgi:hypothetical protein
MQLGVEKIAAIVTMAGSLLFLGAAFLGTPRVYMEPSPAKKLEIIQASPKAWSVAQILFALGALATAGGLASAVIELRGQAAALLVYGSAPLPMIGALTWTGHLFARMQDPAAFAMGALPLWPLLVYFVLTPIGFAGLGLALVPSALADWVGWMLIGSMLLILIVTAVSRDIPPLVYYLPTLVAGVMLYRQAP